MRRRRSSAIQEQMNIPVGIHIPELASVIRSDEVRAGRQKPDRARLIQSGFGSQEPVAAAGEGAIARYGRSTPIRFHSKYLVTRAISGHENSGWIDGDVAELAEARR